MVATSTEAKIQPAAAAKQAATDDQKAAAQAEAEAAAEAHPYKGLFVQYLGPSRIAANAEELKTRKPKLGEGTKAEISVSDWKQVGVTATHGHVWSLANNWRIPASRFTEEQIDYLQTYSKRFQLVNRDGEPADPAE